MFRRGTWLCGSQKVCLRKAHICLSFSHSSKMRFKFGSLNEGSREGGLSVGESNLLSFVPTFRDLITL